VRRDPRGDVYETVTIVRRGESIAPEAFPNDLFEVEAFLP
jgi:hypothetical protein